MSFDKSISGEEINNGVFKRCEKYKHLNILEHFSMYMGCAQLLEFALKNLLVRRYKYTPNHIEKFTLGKTKNKLKESGLRPDFIELLENVVKYRNYMAHEFLADDVLLKSLNEGFSGRLVLKRLNHATFELEKVMFLFDWCEENDGWGENL